MKVGQHAFGVDEHGLDEVCGFVQQVVGQRRRVGDDDALGRRMRDVALVPEGDIFESGLCVRADNAR